jgi:hypothetical protein
MPKWWRIRAQQRRRRDEMAVIGSMSRAPGRAHTVLGLMRELGLSSARIGTALARLEGRHEVRYRREPATGRFTYYI